MPPLEATGGPAAALRLYSVSGRAPFGPAYSGMYRFETSEIEPVVTFSELMIGKM